MPDVNFAMRYIEEVEGLSITEARLDANDCCCSFAGDVQQWLESQGIPARLLWFEDASGWGLYSRYGHAWKYHCAIEVGGAVHDLWHDAALPTLDYVSSMFPGQVVRVECPTEGTEEEEMAA